MSENRPITRLLGEWRNGDADALDHVMALVYDDLRDIAARAWQGESRQVTLEPSAIVHEAYLRLVQLKDIEWRDRTHFLAMASRLVRRVLVDHARARGAIKRSAGPGVALAHFLWAYGRQIEGTTLCKSGRAAAGEQSMRAALAARESSLPAGHWLIMSTRSELGRCLISAKRYPEAEALLLQSYKYFLAERGPDDEKTLDARSSLAELYLSSGQTDKAAAYRNRGPGAGHR